MQYRTLLPLICSLTLLPLAAATDNGPILANDAAALHNDIAKFVQSLSPDEIYRHIVSTAGLRYGKTNYVLSPAHLFALLEQATKSPDKKRAGEAFFVLYRILRDGITNSDLRKEKDEAMALQLRAHAAQCGHPDAIAEMSTVQKGPLPPFTTTSTPPASAPPPPPSAPPPPPSAPPATHDDIAAEKKARQAAFEAEMKARADARRAEEKDAAEMQLFLSGLSCQLLYEHLTGATVPKGLTRRHFLDLLEARSSNGAREQGRALFYLYLTHANGVEGLITQSKRAAESFLARAAKCGDPQAQAVVREREREAAEARRKALAAQKAAAEERARRRAQEKEQAALKERQRQAALEEKRRQEARAAEEAAAAARARRIAEAEEAAAKQKAMAAKEKARLKAEKTRDKRIQSALARLSCDSIIRFLRKQTTLSEDSISQDMAFSELKRRAGLTGFWKKETRGEARFSLYQLYNSGCPGVIDKSEGTARHYLALAIKDKWPAALALAEPLPDLVVSPAERRRAEERKARLERERAATAAHEEQLLRQEREKQAALRRQAAQREREAAARAEEAAARMRAAAERTRRHKKELLAMTESQLYDSIKGPVRVGPTTIPSTLILEELLSRAENSRGITTLRGKAHYFLYRLYRDGGAGGNIKKNASVAHGHLQAAARFNNIDAQCLMASLDRSH